MKVYLSTATVNAENHSAIGVSFFLQTVFGEKKFLCWSEWMGLIEAHAIKELLEREYRERTEAIRRDAYNAGFSDAKAKRAKRTTFNDCFDSDEV